MFVIQQSRDIQSDQNETSLLKRKSDEELFTPTRYSALISIAAVINIKLTLQ